MIDAIEESIDLATAENVRQTAPIADKTYKREWQKFKDFVDSEREQGRLPLGDKYLTRNNVDFYFSTVIALRDRVMPESARRVVSSLQFFANREEYPTEEFAVDSLHVKRALDAQRHRYFSWIAEQEMKDPHANLPTDILGEHDHAKVLDLIFEQYHDNWQNLAFSWNCCTQTYVRGDSVRKFQLPDLRLDESHKREGDCRIISIVLRQGRHKQKADKTRVVGCYRHREFQRCTTGVLAMVLFVRMYNNREIDFYARTRDESNMSWRNKFLLSGWSSHRAHAAAYESLLLAAGISWSKVTHLRKAGMEQASAHGDLNVDEQATMSKHKSDKVFRYVSELYAPVMKVMAGFSRTEPYCVPRCDISIPFEHFEKRIFPLIDVWRNQMNSPSGDKSSAASNFLDKMLPFLAEVVIQDGIFWINQFPHHEASILLKNAMPPNYEQWAREKREEIHHRMDIRAESHVANLNHAAQSSFDRLLAEVANLAKKERTIDELKDQVLALRATIDELVGKIEASGMRHNVAQSSSNRSNAGIRAPLRLARVEEGPKNNALCLLRPSPLLPPFSRAMPLSMTQLLREHDEYDYNLEAYQTANAKKGWPSALRLAYSRRKYLYDMLVKRAKAMRNNLDTESRKQRIAAIMDAEMAAKNIANTYQYLTFLKSIDTTTRKRKRQHHDQL